MKKSTLTKAHERCLLEQTITAEQPGPVLRDFRMLLDFLGPQGVEAAGRYNLLPIKLIGELDGRLSRPLRLALKRPQIRSHPYLQGLNLLLRASGLGRVEGTGGKARLGLDPEMLARWDRLNPTEQYFNLLEAWLRFARAEMVGDRGSSFSMLPKCLQAWQFLPKEGRRAVPNNPEAIHIYGIWRDFYNLALMDLFGLMAVEQPQPPVTPWVPASVSHAPFGDAVFTLLSSRLDRVWGEAVLETGEDEDEDEEEGPEGPRFGDWQPIFQPYFPEWRENLEFPESEPREGTFIFRVSYGKDVWRLIAMPSDDTLDDLVSWILRSLKFDDEHLYEFIYRNRMGATVRVVHPAMDEGPWADQVPIAEVPLEPGQTMQLLYDFGDSWRFDVKLERIEPPGARIKAPGIAEKHGKAPRQYPAWDE